MKIALLWKVTQCGVLHSDHGDNYENRFIMESDAMWLDTQ
jgi:hypothetical protein